MPFTLRRALHTPSCRSHSIVPFTLRRHQRPQRPSFEISISISISNIKLDLTCEMPETKHSPWYDWLSTRTTPYRPNEQRVLSMMLRCTNCGVECMYPTGGKPCVRVVPATYEAESSYLMRKAIRGHQRSSEVIRGRPCQIGSPRCSSYQRRICISISISICISISYQRRMVEPSSS